MSYHDAPSGEKCVSVGCRGRRRARGLCMSCYVFALRRVKSKQDTWKSLEERKMALPRERKMPSALAKRIRKAEAKCRED